MTEREKARQGRSKAFRIVRFTILYLILLPLLLGVGGVTFLFWQISRDLPPVENIYALYDPQQTIFVFAKKRGEGGGMDDVPIARHFPGEDRIIIAKESIPPLARKAFTAAEDPHFFSHEGVDYRAFAKAMLMNVERWWRGARLRGGSTITMQVVRRFIISAEKTFARKAKELILSNKLESVMSKEEIFFLYVNDVALGPNISGIGAAALRLFSVEPQDIGTLNLFQWAILAGLPKGPSDYYPLLTPKKGEDPNKYLINCAYRVKYVYDEMLAQGMIPPEVYQGDLPFQRALDEGQMGKGEYERLFIQRIIKEAKPYNPPYFDLANHFKYSKVLHKQKQTLRSALGTCGRDCYIRTTIDVDIQAVAERELRYGLHRMDRRKGRYLGPLDVASPDLSLSLKELVPHEIYKGRFLAFQEGEGKKGQRVTRAKALLGYDEVDLDVSWVRLWGQGKKGQAKEDVIRPADTILISYQKEEGKEVFRLEQVPGIVEEDKFNPLEGAVVVVENKTGKLLASAGGYDFHLNQNDHTEAMRQPGSSGKPLIAALLMSQKGYHPEQLVSNADDHYLTDCHEVMLEDEEYYRYVHGQAMRPPNPLTCNDVRKRHSSRLPSRYSLCVDHSIKGGVEVEVGKGEARAKVRLEQRAMFLCDPSKTYMPRRHGDHGDEVSIRTTVAKSINRASVSMLCELGHRQEIPRTVIVRGEETTMQLVHCAGSLDLYRAFLARFGIEVGSEAGVAAALGSFEVTPMQLTGAFSMIASEGVYTPIWFVEGEGEGGTAVLPPGEAYLARRVLEAVIDEGTGARARRSLMGKGGYAALAGKTGTTNESRDAWFSGFTPQVTMVVWTGYDKPHPLGRGAWGEGSRTALLIWIDILEALSKEGLLNPKATWEDKGLTKRIPTQGYDSQGNLTILWSEGVTQRGPVALPPPRYVPAPRPEPPAQPVLPAEGEEAYPWLGEDMEP